MEQDTGKYGTGKTYKWKVKQKEHETDKEWIKQKKLTKENTQNTQQVKDE